MVRESQWLSIWIWTSPFQRSLHITSYWKCLTALLVFSFVFCNDSTLLVWGKKDRIFESRNVKLFSLLQTDRRLLDQLLLVPPWMFPSSLLDLTWLNYPFYRRILPNLTALIFKCMIASEILKPIDLKFRIRCLLDTLHILGMDSIIYQLFQLQNN